MLMMTITIETVCAFSVRFELQRDSKQFHFKGYSCKVSQKLDFHFVSQQRFRKKYSRTQNVIEKLIHLFLLIL